MVHVKYVSIELVSGARVCPHFVSFFFETLKIPLCIDCQNLASKHNHNPLDLSEQRYSGRASECMFVSLISLY